IDENKEDNVYRLLSAIEEADSMRKIDYFINITKARLMMPNDVSQEDFFRIIKAINDNLVEDLEYLSYIATSHNSFEANLNVLALSQYGLMILSEIKETNIEKQVYSVTKLGKMVDRFALSLDNNEHKLFYKKNEMETKLQLKTPPARFS
ncbi:MAG: hypothetical protein HUK24_00955, partial [Sphaerochaetaceae bacterium]|nr:hypothetical protein [Sphaerochaetaceae bacterium]